MCVAGCVDMVNGCGTGGFRVVVYVGFWVSVCVCVCSRKRARGSRLIRFGIAQTTHTHMMNAVNVCVCLCAVLYVCIECKYYRKEEC